MSTHDARRRQAADAHRRLGKVTGKHVYAADFALPGMLFGKVLRSSEAHARIVRLDAAKALALPGVRTVLTAAGHPADPLRHGDQGRAGLRRGRRALPRPADRRRRRDHPRDRRGGGRGHRGRVRAAAARCSIPEAALAPGAPLVHAGWSDYQALPVLAPRGQHLIGRSHRRRRRRARLRRVLPHLRAPLHDRSMCIRLHRAARGRGERGTATATSRSGGTRSFPST